MQAIEQTAERILPNDISTAWSGVSFQESRASQSGFMVYVAALPRPEQS